VGGVEVGCHAASAPKTAPHLTHFVASVLSAEPQFGHQLMDGT